MPKLDTHDPHLADILRRASLEREQQDQRLADIFGMQTVPKVTEETLASYLDRIDTMLVRWFPQRVAVGKLLFPTLSIDHHGGESP